MENNNILAAVVSVMTFKRKIDTIYSSSSSDEENIIIASNREKKPKRIAHYALITLLEYSHLECKCYFRLAFEVCY